ncbi:hypothetical protein TWF173_006726 [Orbilia oligospora]|nr:hypothetical protein TWF173_006726 [Orbilia oligospora]
MTRLSVNDYKVGWLTALYVEFSAAIAMLDSQHETPKDYKSKTETPNHYTFGEINGINVVITTLPDGVYGNISATRVATDFSNEFPNLGLRFLVGIAGGAPKERNDIRLGDIVVSRPSENSPGVIKHDSGKSLDSGFKLTGVLSKPPETILRALPLVRRWPEKTLSAAIFQILANAFEKDNQGMLRPPVDEDVLFHYEYQHRGEESSPYPDVERNAEDVALALRIGSENHVHSTSAYAQTHTSRASERELLPLTNSVTTADGTKIRQYGDAMIQGRAIINGAQTYETEEFMDFSSKEGKIFNGSQKFKSKGPMRF